ncbi:FIMAH domain-containing protein [Lederbergia citri]|uniref:Chitobiase/beta-hexosaminidase C-terminal domain-containing protein n=1 Tax=Lederbergia citri TaxID=2833580 RepID=A0A942YK10_9BACI|nr:chitobiase/beta-hexosaminidase C-terminal domain-containing protein [Lederbergia citri]MBS4196896.1 chitobiase/beta-hexosaminidase C-terminal domain-containing protein [Lederbergia citri]
MGKTKKISKFIMMAIITVLFVMLFSVKALNKPVQARESQFTNKGSGPLYYNTYDWQDSHNSFFPESRMKPTIDWLAENYLPFGFEYFTYDGWINGGTRHTEHGYVTTHNDSWEHDIGYWADYAHSKGLKFGVYYAPFWLLKSIADGPTLYAEGTDYTLKSITSSNTFEDWYLIDPDKPGAENYIKGFINYLKGQGVDSIKVDFLHHYENRMGTKKLETVLKWMNEACGDDMFLSFSAPNNKNHANIERKYGDMIRISQDIYRGGWGPFSSNKRGIRKTSNGLAAWPEWDNSFDALIDYSDLSGKGTVILDPDFVNASSFNTDTEAMTAVSLYVMAGAGVGITDSYENIGRRAFVFQNSELYDLNRKGFVGKPLTRDVNNPLSQIWKGQLTDGTWVVGLFNREETAQNRTIDFFDDLGIDGDFLVSDIWSHTTIGTMSSYSEDIEPHGVRLLKISKLTMEPYGGFVTKPQEVRMSSIDPNAEIHYTLDGSEPDEDSPRYTKPILVDSPTIVRAKIIQGDGKGYEAKGIFVEEPKKDPVVEIAEGIKTITAPVKDAESLVLPKAHSGYTVRIKSTDHSDVIQEDGVIFPPEKDTIVKLVLEVMRDSDRFKADTDPISVLVPAGSEGNYKVTYDSKSVTLSGNAKLSNCSACTTGQKIGNLGNGPNNFATFNNVYAPGDGTYTMSIDYLTGDPRSLFVSVNGEEGKELLLTGPSFSTVRSTTMTVQLKEGTNSVKLYNDSGWAPDVSKIVIRSISAHTIASKIQSITAPEKDVTSVTMPTVPSGFAAKIKSSDRPDIINTDGTIYPTNRDIIVNLIIEVTRIYDGQVADTEAIQVVVPARTITIQSVRETIDSYILSGDVTVPLVNQLNVRLDQAEKHINNGKKDQAVKKMSDFLKDLDNEPMQRYISEEAKIRLKSDAQALIVEWTTY